MTVKVSAFEADELIKAWKADALFGACMHILDGRFYFPQGISVRVMFGKYCKLANDALWDGKDDLAKRYMLKFGIDGRSTRANSAGTARASVIRHDPRRAAEFRK